MKNAIINNLFLDVPVLKKGKVIQKLDFFRSVVDPILYNPKFTEHMFSIIPLKKEKVWIHYYQKGNLTHVGVYSDGEIKKANLHLIKLKADQLTGLNIEEIKGELFRFCEMQIKELEHEDIFHLWINQKNEIEPLTMTHLRTILASKVIGDGSEEEYVSTITCVQDRLPNAGIVQENLSWSDEIYMCDSLQEIMQENGSFTEYEQLGLF